MIIKKLESSLKKLSTKERAKNNAWFFQVFKGGYGQGDLFLGVTVPDIRKVVKEYLEEFNLIDIEKVMKFKYHEIRLAGLIMLVEKMKKAVRKNDKELQKNIYKTYFKVINGINNWDLVDTSASQIVGTYLLDKNRRVLYKLVKSKNLWERRIAIVSTFAFIKIGDYKDTFAISEILMKDNHDLIHKAIGWTLREVGKTCGVETLNIFLKKYAHVMPRVALRYALEKHYPYEKAKFMVMNKY